MQSMGVEEEKKRKYLVRRSTTTMMTKLFLDLGKLTMNSIEMSFQIVGGIEIGWSVPGFLSVSLIALKGITFNHKGNYVIFHAFLERKTFDLL